MQYDNQLVLTGQINDVGEYTRTNVKDSYRRGLEIDGGMYNWLGVHVLLNATLSQNKIVNFTEYVDDWDTWSQIEVNHELTDLAFSPSIIVGSDVGYEFFNKDNNKTANVSFLTKFVGKQYIDNTSNENAELPAYTYSDLLISYSYMGSRWFKEIRFNLNIHNIFNDLYSSNAWVYRFRSLNYDPRSDDPYAREEVPGTYNLTGLYPQAGRHFLAGLSFYF
jgi:iron complex outermembrane receptor protein